MVGAARSQPLKGSTGLGSLGPGADLQLADIGCGFAEYAKQKGRRWLKMCFIRAIVRTGCVRI